MDTHYVYLLKAFTNYYQNFLVTVRKTTETIMAFSARGFYKRVGRGFYVNRDRLFLIAVNRERKNLFSVNRERKYSRDS